MTSWATLAASFPKPYFLKPSAMNPYRERVVVGDVEVLVDAFVDRPADGQAEGPGWDLPLLADHGLVGEVDPG
jgi:hypothetical protein